MPSESLATLAECRWDHLRNALEIPCTSEIPRGAGCTLGWPAHDPTRWTSRVHSCTRPQTGSFTAPHSFTASSRWQHFSPHVHRRPPPMFSPPAYPALLMTPTPTRWTRAMSQRLPLPPPPPPPPPPLPLLRGVSASVRNSRPGSVCSGDPGWDPTLMLGGSAIAVLMTISCLFPACACQPRPPHPARRKRKRRWQLPRAITTLHS